MTRNLFPALLSMVLLLACEDAATGPDAATTPGVVAIKAGGDGTCALLRDGRLLCWGDWGGPDIDSVPQEVPGHLTVTDFAVANNGGAVCAATTEGTIYCWGRYSNWHSEYPPYPQPGPLEDSIPLSRLGPGDGHMCGIGPEGAAYCWGGGYAGKRGQGDPDLNSPPLVLNRVVGGLQFHALAGERSHTCGITLTGGVYCWGLAVHLGDTLGTFHAGPDGCGTVSASCAWAPIPVRTLGNATVLAMSFRESCVVTQAGAAWCWKPATPGPTVGFPTQVDLPEAATDIAVGSRHSCALGRSGTPYCWGEPGPWRGTNALGTLTEVNSPVAFASITAGVAHTCGLDRTGTAYCWGDNLRGQLGNGTHETSSHPVHLQFPGEGSHGRPGPPSPR